MATTSAYLDVLRLPPAEAERILRAHLPAGEEPPSLRDRRSEPRYRYGALTKVLLQVCYPSRQIGHYRALSWNISCNGLGFLHGKFVYPGSQCRVFLRSVDDEVLALDGLVCRCRHLEGRVHEAGMRFEKSIDLGTILKDFEPDEEEIARLADLRTR